MTEEVSAVPSPADVAARVADRTFTQAEVNEIVQGRLKSAKADYEQLQARVASVEELEQRNQKLTTELSSLQLDALRMRVASQFGISSEDRDLLLTATDEDSLRLQAERLGSAASQRLSGGNVAPREGGTVEVRAAGGRDLRSFANELFGSDSVWD